MSPSKARPKTLPLVETPHQFLLRELAPLVKDIDKFGQLVADRIGDELRQSPDMLRTHIQGTRFLFQKWNLEMLYLLALFQKLRFGELQKWLLGISSRTLSLKLAELEKAGFVTRKVLADRPLRVEYAVTPHGRTSARLAIPLVLFLGANRTR